MDNHENPRFLNLNPSTTALKNELTFVIMGDWISIIYDGIFRCNGGSDPRNGEFLSSHVHREVSSFIVYLKVKILYLEWWVGA